MSLPDQLERAGIVVGSMVMLALPASLVLYAVEGTTTTWWGPLALLAPGFVVGWAVAAEQVPFDYDDVWFVCFFGYALSIAGVLALDLQPFVEHTVAVLVVGAVSFGVTAVVDFYRR